MWKRLHLSAGSLTLSPSFLLKNDQSFTLRLLISGLIGNLAGFYCYWKMSGNTEPIASDFTYHWVAIRALFSGESPYQVVQPGLYNFNAGYLYPLPTALVLSPFALFSPVVGASVLAGISGFLLTLVLPKTQVYGLGGIPFIWCITSGQTGGLSLAGTLLPGMGFLALLKPNIALALIAYRPRASMLYGGLALTTVALVLQPTWIQEWVAVVQSRTEGNYGSPLLIPMGPLLLFSALRWRTPEGRLLLVMASVPQSLLFYDQLPLLLIPKTRNESMLLAITGMVGYMVASWMLPVNATPSVASSIYGPAILWSLYFPCLVMVLRKPIAEPEERVSV